VDTLKSYSQEEAHFFGGFQFKFLNNLSLHIKMLLAEKGVLRM
jgi:hypothetical protein